MKSLMISLLVLILVPPAFAEAPQWASTPPQRLGSSLQVACHGAGPDRSTAYKSALNECRTLASETLLQNFKIKTLSLQTESDTGYHEEVSYDSHIEGLSCNIKDSEEDSESNGTWLLCEFNTQGVKIVQSVEELQNETIESDNRQIILSTVPKCDSIVVSGANPRIIMCGGNPMTVLTHPGDQEMIIRAKGYLSKHLTPEEWSQPSLIEYLERD